ncbi:hypothetical protein T439DRAFT_327379 [Meredithblackwellia eburnea MCA 4105]
MNRPRAPSNRTKPSYQNPSKVSPLVGLATLVVAIGFITVVFVLRYAFHGPVEFRSSHPSITIVYSAFITVLASIFGQLVSASYQHYVRACCTTEIVTGNGNLYIEDWEEKIASFSFGGMLKSTLTAKRRWAGVVIVAGLASGGVGACYSLQQSARVIKTSLFALDFADLEKAATSANVSFAPGGPIFPNDRTHVVGDLTAALYRVAANLTTTSVQSGGTKVSTTGIMPMPLDYNIIIGGQNIKMTLPVNFTHNSYGATSQVTCSTGSTTLVQVTPVPGTDVTVYNTTSLRCGSAVNAYLSDNSFTDSRACLGATSTSRTVEIVRFNGVTKTLISSTTCNVTAATVPIQATYFFNTNLSTISTRGDPTPLSSDAFHVVNTVLADWLTVTSGGSGNPGWTSLGLVEPTLQPSDKNALETIIGVLVNLAVSKTLAQANNALNGLGVSTALNLGLSPSSQATAHISVPILAVGFTSTSTKELGFVAGLGVVILVVGVWFRGIVTKGTSREFDPTSVVDVFKMFDDSPTGVPGVRRLVREPLTMVGVGQNSQFQ